MKKSDCAILFDMIIASDGRPADGDLVKQFGIIAGNEISRDLYLGRFAIFTDKELVKRARIAREKM